MLIWVFAIGSTNIYFFNFMEVKFDALRFNSFNWIQLSKMSWIDMNSRGWESEMSRCLQPLSSMNSINAVEIICPLRSILCHRDWSWEMLLNLFDTWPQFKRSLRSKLANTLSTISSGKSASSKTLSALFMVTAIVLSFLVSSLTNQDLPKLACKK